MTMISDDCFRFFQAREREFELSHEMTSIPNNDARWELWSLAAAAVDSLAANLQLSDNEIHDFDRQLQAVMDRRSKL